MITRNFLFTAPCEVEWEEHEVNDQPGPGQVLVEAHSSVISAGTDVSIYSGTHKNINNPDAPWPKYPHRPGGHVAGTVLAVGEGISELREGDRIVFGGQYTRFHVLEPAISQLQKLPEEVSFAEAVLARHSTVSLHGIRTSRMTLGRSGADRSIRCAICQGGRRRQGDRSGSHREKTQDRPTVWRGHHPRPRQE